MSGLKWFPSECIFFLSFLPFTSVCAQSDVKSGLGAQCYLFGPLVRKYSRVFIGMAKLKKSKPIYKLLVERKTKIMGKRRRSSGGVGGACGCHKARGMQHLKRQREWEKEEREKGTVEGEKRIGNRPFSPSVLFFSSRPVSVHQCCRVLHQRPSSAGRTLTWILLLFCTEQNL